jgi:hypothetical protein
VVDRRGVGCPGPKETETVTMPGDDRFGLDEDEGRPPPWPDAGQPDPEEAVGSGQPNPPRPSARQDVDLVTQRENLKLCSTRIPMQRHDVVRTETRAKGQEHRASREAEAHTPPTGRVTASDFDRAASPDRVRRVSAFHRSAHGPRYVERATRCQNAATI